MEDSKMTLSEHIINIILAGGLILTLLIGPLTMLLKRFLEKFDYTVEK